MATHRLKFSYVGNSLDLSEEISDTQTGVAIIDNEQITTGTTDGEVLFALEFANCTMFYLVSDQDVTFETNDGAAADDTIALLADIPYVWHTNSYDTFLITADIITNVFITNVSGETASIYCVALFDATT